MDAIFRPKPHGVIAGRPLLTNAHHRGGNVNCSSLRHRYRYSAPYSLRQSAEVGLTLCCPRQFQHWAEASWNSRRRAQPRNIRGAGAHLAAETLKAGSGATVRGLACAAAMKADTGRNTATYRRTTARFMRDLHAAHKPAMIR